MIPGLGRSPGEGKGYPLQYSGLENAMDCVVYGVPESDTTERLALCTHGAPGKTLHLTFASTILSYFLRKGHPPQTM